jgi:biopolymer transport protein ExbB/TolQ
MLRKIIISFIILILYLLSMVAPYVASQNLHVIDSKSKYLELYLGVIHLPSIFFILGSFFILLIGLKTNKLQANLKKELIESVEIIESENIEKILISDNLFVKKILEIISKGGMEEDIVLVIENKMQDLFLYYESLMAKYNYISVLLPMLGMLGTITGLLQMFAVSNGIDNIAAKMVGLSVALATTLYASLIVILYVKPKYKHFEEEMMILENFSKKLELSAKLLLHNIDIYSLQKEEE